MAIAFDNSGTNTASGTVSTTFTVSGSATVGFAAVMNGASGWSPSAMTWNGVSMTQVGFVNAVDGNYRLYVYSILNPGTGSISVSCTGSGSSGGIYLIAGSYTGSSTSSAQEAYATQTSTGATLTNTVTVATSNAWTISFVTDSTDGGTKPTANTGCTRRAYVGGIMGLFDSNASLATGSQSMIYNTTGTTSGGLIMSVPVASASGPTNLKSLNTNLKANIKSYNTNVIANVKSINTNA
jgi:hypothetical protein